MLIWLYSFLVQSTLFLGATWLLLKCLPNIQLRAREMAWNTAILAALVGPTIHVAMPQLLPTSWHLPGSMALTSQSTLANPGSAQPAAASAQPAMTPNLLNAAYLHNAQNVGAARPALIQTQPVAAEVAPPNPWIQRVTWMWWLGAAFCLVSFGWRLQRFHYLLRNRQPVLNPGIRLMLDRLRLAAQLPRPVRLTFSNNLGSPVALGVGRNAEICLPERALLELPAEQIHAMLGHEVAHHMRRDPVHLVLLNGLQAVFFFQPLLRVARADMHQTAEQQCDAWGAQQTGDHWSMARCLASVATWLLPADAGDLAVGMARRKSHLTLRVRSLMDENQSDQMLRAPGRRHLGAAALALAVAPILAPQVVLAAPSPELDDSLIGTEISFEDNATRSYIDGDSGLTQSDADQLAKMDEIIFRFQQEVEGLRHDLGPLSQHPKYEPILKEMDQKLQTILRLRGLFQQLLLLLNLEEGPSSEKVALNPKQTTDSNS